MEDTTAFDILVAKNGKKLEKYSIHIVKMEAARRGSEVGEDGSINKNRVKLPVLNIPPFDGNPLQWQTFIDTFEASVHKRQDLYKSFGIFVAT